MYSQAYMTFLCAIFVSKSISVFVIDNASYHTQKHDLLPTNSSTYATMKTFCATHSIDYPTDFAMTDRKLKVVSQYVRLYQ